MTDGVFEVNRVLSASFERRVYEKHVDRFSGYVGNSGVTPKVLSEQFDITEQLKKGILAKLPKVAAERMKTLATSFYFENSEGHDRYTWVGEEPKTDEPGMSVTGDMDVQVNNGQITVKILNAKAKKN
jgi:hypothetical protein